MQGQLHGENIRKFILAGNATFTLLNPVTGGRFTYKVRAPRDNNEAPIRFVSVLRGPDNSRDFGYIGTIRIPENEPDRFQYGGDKATVNPEAKSVKAFEWFWKRAVKPEPCEIYHDGKCGRCGRKLTVPESVSSGYGPECIGRIR